MMDGKDIETMKGGDRAGMSRGKKRCIDKREGALQRWAYRKSRC
jgi:hypothetical protein